MLSYESINQMIADTVIFIYILDFYKFPPIKLACDGSIMLQFNKDT